MPLFHIINSTVKQLPLDAHGFGNEFSLRDFFADNLEDILGVRFLAKEFQIAGGRIDTIGIDENNSPVIIEYKWKENDDVLSQGLFYLAWLQKNKAHFTLFVQSIFGKGQGVNWEQPRLILIAQGFNKYIKSAVEQVGGVELKTYKVYKGNILQVEDEYTPPGQKIPVVKKTFGEAKTGNISQDGGSAIATSNAPVGEYNLEFHLNITTLEMRKAFLEIRDRLLKLPDVEEKEGQKSGITYRTTKSITRFEFRGTWIQVLLREPVYEIDNLHLVKDVTTHGWGFKGSFKFTPETDIDYLFALIESSYNSTL
jgi:predicted transport protein